TYSAGLDMAAFEQVDPRFAKLHAYGDGHRALVIIDESMPQLFEARVDAKAIDDLIGLLGPVDLVAHYQARRVLGDVQYLLRRDATASAAISDEALSRWMQVSTTEADDALVALGHAVLAAKVKYMRKAMHLISSVRALMEDARWRYVGRAKTML